MNTKHPAQRQEPAEACAKLSVASGGARRGRQVAAFRDVFVTQRIAKNMI
jgi:hypothetical protein